MPERAARGNGDAIRGRDDRAMASLVAAAVELASLAESVCPVLLDTVKRVCLEYTTATLTDEVKRMLYLASLISGLSGNRELPTSGQAGEVVFLDGVEGKGLSVGELYETTFPGRFEEWSYVGPGSRDGLILITQRGVTVQVTAADYGLCPYGVTTGGWHPTVRTRRLGGNILDGKTLASMIGREAETTEFDFEGGDEI